MIFKLYSTAVASVDVYLALCALQVAGDTCVFGPVQHGAQLLTKL